jgi:hypothetical protein
VIVDGKTENIGTEKKIRDATIVTVDQSKLGKNIGGAATVSPWWFRYPGTAPPRLPSW